MTYCHKYQTISTIAPPGPSSSGFAKKLDFVQKIGISAKKLDFSKKAGFQQKNRISGSFFMDFIVGAHRRLELQKSGISDISEIQLFCTKSLFFAQNPGFLRKQMAKNLDFRVHTVGAHRNPGFLSVGGWNPGFLLKSRFFARNPAFLQTRWRGLWVLLRSKLFLLSPAPHPVQC